MGTPDAVALAVPFAEAVMVGKVEMVEKVERVCFRWCLVRERGRALEGWGDRVSVRWKWVAKGSLLGPTLGPAMRSSTWLNHLSKM